MAGMFKGVVVATITPFTHGGKVDLEAFRWLLEGLGKAGVHGVWVGGTTGEWTSLALGELERLYRVAVETLGGKAAVFAGVGALGWEESLKRARVAGDLGVDYVFSTPLLYYKADRERLLEYYQGLAKASGRPVFVYNIPSHVGYGIGVGDLAWMAIESSEIAGVKATVNDYTYLGELVSIKEVRRDFSIMPGTEELLLHTLAIGGDGAVSALANLLPRLLTTIWEAVERGDLRQALVTTRQSSEARRILSRSGVPMASSIKGVLHALGAPLEPHVRRPLYPLPSETVEAIAENLCRSEDLARLLHPGIQCITPPSQVDPTSTKTR